MIVQQRLSLVKRVALIFTLSLVGGFVYRYVVQSRRPIYTYNAQTDRQEIVDLFEQDRYWLTSNPDSDVGVMLDTKSPNKQLRYRGALNIDVLRKNNNFIGFTAYYKKTETDGFLLFVAVKKEFKGKRYGAKLVNHAVEQLFKLGAQKVKLVTRTNNLRAINLYTRLGFTETLRDDEGYVFFEKKR